jgi:hypothetical protein
VHPAGQPGPEPQAGQYGPYEPHKPTGPIDRFMDWLIRTLAWSRLSNPKIAVGLSGAGLLLGILLGATAPNAETLRVRLPLSTLLPSLGHQHVIASLMLYAADILACLGLAGMLWAHSQGWRPNPRVLLMVSSAIAGVMVCLTPVGSSDTASYAAYGRIAAQGANPYTTTPHAFGDHAYTMAVGTMWRKTPSVYGPFATFIQSFAASIGKANPAVTIWILMILNGAVFIGVGLLLLKTSDDPVRATLFWTANPVLIQQLVGGGHLDTFVAAFAICAIQLARRSAALWSDVLIGVLVGLAAGIKIYAVLIGLGLAWPLLRRQEWLRVARISAVAVLTLGLGYASYGIDAIKPLGGGLSLVTLPSPWRVLELIGERVLPYHNHVVADQAMASVISLLWPPALLVVAYLLHRRISSDQPREIVAPFALVFAWILVAPWVFAWYTAVAWAALTQVPRNPMTRWLTLVTVFLALCLSSGGGRW